MNSKNQFSKFAALTATLLLMTASISYGGDENKCFAKAMPTKGHGGNSWAPTKGQAEDRALANCRKFASQTGGDPNTCRIVESHCK